MRRYGLVSASMAAMLCLPIVACDDGGTATASVDRNAVASTIRDSEREMLADFRSRDAEKVAAHYASDATVMFTNRAIMNGEEAIRTGMAESLTDPAFAIDFANQKTEVAASGDLAYSRGTYTVSYTSPETSQPVTERGSYVTVYARQSDGNWKIVEDIATPNAPAAPSAPVPG